jgi:hypothetical protein
MRASLKDCVNHPWQILDRLNPWNIKPDDCAAGWRVEPISDKPTCHKLITMRIILGYLNDALRGFRPRICKDSPKLGTVFVARSLRPTAT